MANAKTKGEIQKCNVCGNVVEVLTVGGGPLVCCGEPMELLMAKSSADEKAEKHVPVIEKTANGVRVKVGSVPHPMEEEHFIEWIEIIADGKTYRQYLQPVDAPAAEFDVAAEEITARAYCNVHGLWQS